MIATYIISEIAECNQSNEDEEKISGLTFQQYYFSKFETNELGNLVLIQLDAGEEFNPAVMERYEAIKEARQVIETTSSAKKVKKMICPKCGSKTATGMNYCGVCGAKITE